ncbi:autotransporter outer membrane beta-barrel domain-containing protein [Gaetbulibacter saemankumensis]|uniref:autotransporter outer membrane beta-barrel domain-containing protein n=1 Tax=Gaetbulibacter saemankumensis TaxID=311208 RepID=UPI00040C09A1|nr:autotransporter outer membrane beta-barrel domain-containing protein [Gaetbulibacter saemankumensis]
MHLTARLFAVLFIGAIHCFAQRSNYKFNNFGNRSIVLAGNVTGSVSDIGLSYYNPSFLANTTKVGFSLNARAYQIENIKLDNVLNEDSKLSTTKFSGASNMAGGIFNLFGTKFAYTYLTKSNHNSDLYYDHYYLNDDILAIFPNAIKHNASINLMNKVRDDWTGITWAYTLAQNFYVGVSLFGSIYSHSGRSNLNHTVESENNEVAFYKSYRSFSQTSYGAFFKIGFNYSLKKLQLGMNINLPYLEVYNDGTFGYTEVVAGVNQEYNKFIDYDFRNLKSKRKEPLGISIGAGIPINKSKLHLNVDYITGIKSFNRINIPSLDLGLNSLTTINFNEARVAVLNFGVGAELFLNEKIKLYGGFSTDFSPLKKTANIFDLSVENTKETNLGDDFYHISMGIDWTLKWANLIFGITHANSKNSFLNPYTINAEGFKISNAINSELRYTRLQFMAGIDVPVFNKKINNIIKLEEN